MPRRSRPKVSEAALALRFAERRRDDFERVGMQGESAMLSSNENVVVERARRADAKTGSRGNVERAHRSDVFDRLHARGALSDAAHIAARRLDADLTERRGDGGREQSTQPSGSFGSRDLVTIRSLDAGRRVDAVKRLIGRRDAELLVELLEPRRVLAGDGVDRWRIVVGVVCGETRSEVQAGAVRSACENLSLAYGELDNASRKAS